MARKRKAKAKRRVRRGPKRKSVVQVWSGRLPPMKRADFAIGCEFLTAAGRWRCTDVGKRTIAAIRLNHDDDPSWYNGPPYAVVETVFDEYDFQGYEPAPGRSGTRQRSDVVPGPARSLATSATNVSRAPFTKAPAT